MIEVISNTEPRARKVHRCNFCLEKIKVGEKYHDQLCKYDGIYHWRSHLKCIEIADKLKMFDNCDEGLTDDDFYENIREEFSRIQSEVNNEFYESKEFIIPPFYMQLGFVCAFHKYGK